MSSHDRFPRAEPGTSALLRDAVFAAANQERWWAVDRSRRLVHFSEPFASDFERVFGVTLEIGMAILDLLPSSERATWSRNYDEAFAGTRAGGEYVARWPDGTRHYDLRFVRAGLASPIVAVFAHEVTPLREAEARTRALLSSHPDVLLVASPDGLIVEGYGEHEGDAALAVHAVGKRVDHVLPSPTATAVLDAIRRMAPGSTSGPFAFEVSGSPDPSAYEVRLSRGTTSREILVVLTDTTERRAMQSRLLAAERLASLGVVAAAVAHEINNPLAYALGNVETALAQLPSIGDNGLVEDIRHALEDASDGVRRAAGIVRDLRAHSPRGSDRHEPLDLGEVVQRVLRLMRRSWPADVELELTLDAVPRVNGSEGRLAQVISNLLRNALEAVRDESLTKRKVCVRLAREGPSWIALEVEDSGRGVPPEIRPRLFEQFASARGKDGTGLGLWISAGIVTEHGGTITAHDATGAGALFRVRLPVTVGENGDVRTAPPPATAPDAHRTAPRVLVIDDEPMLRSAIARMLADHELVLAASAPEALEILEHDAAFDVILCDLSMPGMSGAVLRDEIRRRWPRSAGALVLMTGGAVDAAGRAALEDAQWVLEKPFDRQVLRTTIASIMRARASL